MEHMIFKVECTALAGGFKVEVDAGEAREAQIVAPSAMMALEMANAFMLACVLHRPDPLDEQFWLPSAPDGPRGQ